jgi:hypothetical protein
LLVGQWIETGVFTVRFVFGGFGRLRFRRRWGCAHVVFRLVVS